MTKIEDLRDKLVIASIAQSSDELTGSPYTFGLKDGTQIVVNIISVMTLADQRDALQAMVDTKQAEVAATKVKIQEIKDQIALLGHEGPYSQ